MEVLKYPHRSLRTTNNIFAGVVLLQNLLNLILQSELRLLRLETVNYVITIVLAFAFAVWNLVYLYQGRRDGKGQLVAIILGIVFVLYFVIIRSILIHRLFQIRQYLTGRVVDPLVSQQLIAIICFFVEAVTFLVLLRKDYHYKV